MRSEPLPFRGAMVLRGEPTFDDRGSFVRIVDLGDLGDRYADVETGVAQVSSVFNDRRGTVRGLHYQAEPHGEAKTLWCTAGAVFDVLVDLRRNEPTYGQWFAVELSANDPTALHIPRGLAHGYQTLEDDSSLTYLISTPYRPESSRSLLWRDPTIGVTWPLDVTAISERDREAPPWPPPS